LWLRPADFIFKFFEIFIAKLCARKISLAILKAKLYLPFAFFPTHRDKRAEKAKSKGFLFFSAFKNAKFWCYFSTFLQTLTRQRVLTEKFITSFCELGFEITN